MKRIAMFIHHEVGGAVVAFYGFMKTFKEHGYRIDLYRINRAGEAFLPLSKMADAVFDYPLRFRSRVQRRLPLIREYVNAWRYWRNLVLLDHQSSTIAKEIDQRNYDLIFVHVDKKVKNPHLLRYLATPTYFYTGEPERIFYDPSFLFTDELDSVDHDVLHRLSSWWYAPAKYLQLRLWKRVSDRNIKAARITVLTNSYFSVEAIARAYGIQAHVCYLGIDTSVFKPLHMERKNQVITVGSLTPNKGHAFLVRSLALIPMSLRPKLIVVTDAAHPNRKQKLLALGKQLKVDIEVCERISETELLQLYATARLFLYGSRLEPFGLAPLEAMAMGLPVVAVKSGGVRETVRDGATGVLVDWNTESFAREIASLLNDTERWRAMSHAGPRYVRENWTWDRTLRRFEEIVRMNVRKPMLSAS